MKISLNKPSIYECEGVTLMPGENDVKDAGKFLANKIVQKDIAAGIITVMHQPKAALVQDVDVSDKNPKVAKPDTDALKELAQGDGRTTEVREARESLEYMGITWDE